MSTPPSPSEAPPPQDAQRQLREAGLYGSERQALQHATVVLAMNEDCWLEFVPEGWRLLVPPTHFERISYQLACFDNETLRWPPPAPVPQPIVGSMDYTCSFLWVMSVVIAYYLQLQAPGRLEEAFCMDSRALFERLELWRPFTALFLHADLGHLSANVLTGFFAFASLRTVFTRSRAWVLLLLSSVFANLFCGLLNLGGDYRSLGASTAIFAALGLLTGQAARHIFYSRSAARLSQLLIPGASGAAMLSLLGAGGLHTDLTAHLAGFVCGCIAGALSKS